MLNLQTVKTEISVALYTRKCALYMYKEREVIFQYLKKLSYSAEWMSVMF
jgi:hypothetical protein